MPVPTPVTSQAPVATTLIDVVEQELQEILGGIETETEAIECIIASGGSGRAEHDETAVKTLHEQAIHDMAWRGVTFTLAEAATAIKVLPKVCLCCIGLSGDS